MNQWMVKTKEKIKLQTQLLADIKKLYDRINKECSFNPFKVDLSETKSVYIHGDGSVRWSSELNRGDLCMTKEESIKFAKKITDFWAE